MTKYQVIQILGDEFEMIPERVFILSDGMSFVIDQKELDFYEAETRRINSFRQLVTLMMNFDPFLVQRWRFLMKGDRLPEEPFFFNVFEVFRGVYVFDLESVNLHFLLSGLDEMVNRGLWSIYGLTTNEVFPICSIPDVLPRLVDFPIYIEIDSDGMTFVSICKSFTK